MFKRKHVLKLHKGTVGDNGKVLYLDYDGSYTAVCVSELRKLTLKRINFTVCKLYLNQPNIKKKLLTAKMLINLIKFITSEETKTRISIFFYLELIFFN